MDSELTLEPDQNYTFKAFMKGENIKPDDSHDTVDVGANLSFRPAENSIKQLEFNYSDSGEESMGTFEWREFEHDFQTDSDGKIKITCRLGNWWNEVTGKIYIDNVSIEKNDSLKTHVGRNIRTDFEKLIWKLYLMQICQGGLGI